MNTLKRFIPLLGLTLAIVYLGIHAWTGDQGVRNHLAIKAEIAKTATELDAARSERLILEDRVARLDDRPDGPGVDVDYLEERARVVLRLAHPDDTIITLDIQPDG